MPPRRSDEQKHPKRKPDHGRIYAVPGSIQVDPEAPAPVVRVMAYGPEQCIEEQLEHLDRLGSICDEFPVVWINVDGLGDAEVIKELGRIFDLHPLALEDTVNTHQRPKVESYDHTAFIVMRMISLSQRVESEQVSMFVGDGFVITFQEHEGDCLDPVRQRIRAQQGRIRRQGADYLAYSLLDAVIDGCFPVLERFGERIEELETEVFRNPREGLISRIHNVKRDLMTIRRSFWPLRDALSALVRDEVKQFEGETVLYLRDCYDHVTQILDIIETHREVSTAVREGYMSSISNRMNEVMKVLTIIATIFIPLSFIAGLYGMNFDPQASPWNMPELKWKYGYPAALLVMAAVAIGMLYYFLRKGWLRGPRDEL
jgi:magnesium transporter